MRCHYLEVGDQGHVGPGTRDVREIDAANHKWQAFFLGMKNTQTGHATEIEVGKLEVGVGASDDQFTERYLEKES